LGAAVPVKPATSQRSAGGQIIALNPWSPTATVRWPHFRALAERLAVELPDYNIIFFAGPGEERAVRDIAGPHPVVAGLPLLEFAAALQDVALFVSNDSGAAHFADALGVPVVMVHGSTDARLTGTGLAVSGGPIWCGPCYRKTCFLGRTCLERIPVDGVVERAREVLDRLFNSG
jgi:heptosyltransferase-2